MWNNIFLPSTTSPPKDLRPKPSPLVEQFLRGTQGLPTFLSQVGVSDPRRKKVLQLFYMWVIYRGGWWLSHPYKSELFIRGSFVEAAQSPVAPTNRNAGGGWWVSRPYKSDPFIGTARINSRPCCSIFRGGWCLGSRARHCRGGSITSRPYKKFVPLLKIVFCSVIS